MSFKSKTVFFVCTFIAVLLFLEAGKKGQAPAIALQDGVYAVLRSAPSASKLLPLKEGEVIVEYDSTMLVLHTKPDVPMLFAEEPVGIYKGGELAISFEFKGAAREKFAALTSRQESTEAAIVIGNEVVASPKVREPILDGQAKITCSAGDSCPQLLERLKKNFKDASAAPAVSTP